MIIYTGLGLIFSLIPMFIYALLVTILKFLEINELDYVQFNEIITLVLSSIIFCLAGIKVNKAKLLAYDDLTGKPIFGKNRHTIFQIPIQYIPIVIFAIIFVLQFFI
jgi:hypothetical protein